MYSFLGLHFSTWLYFIWPLRFLMKIFIQPEGLTLERVEAETHGRDIIYVFPRFYVLDAFVLGLALQRLKLPRARVDARPNRFRHAALLAVRPKISLFYRGKTDSFVTSYSALLKSDKRIHNQRLCLIPVSIFWGLGAERTDRNFILRSIFPDDGNANSIQKILLMLIHSRSVHVHFGKAMDVTETMPLAHKDESLGSAQVENSAPSDADVQACAVPPSPEMIAGRVRRNILISLMRERTATLGPALYDMGSIEARILDSKEVKTLVERSDNPKKAASQAARYLSEIAAAYNPLIVSALERSLDLLWTTIFKGVRVRNFELVEEQAKSGQVLWMPCHRSHLDYLLLSYILRKKGFVAPHIAAGENLSFWPAGPILRRGGAFFLRRSFQGNKLYSLIFSQYVQFLMHESFPIMFFHEGGRSRIGKLLAPKVGMTSICVSSILKRKAANTMIIPVYFGYDKVMEDESYARELHGAKKQKETIWQVLKLLPKLFVSNYGRVDVVFGVPIQFGTVWQEFYGKKLIPRSLESYTIAQLPSRIEDLEGELDPRDPRVHAFVRFLARRVNQGINASATASATALVGSVMLAIGNERMSTAETLLRERISLLQWSIGRLSSYLGWSISTSSNMDAETAFLLTQVGDKEAAGESLKEGPSLEDPVRNFSGSSSSGNPHDFNPASFHHPAPSSVVPMPLPVAASLESSAEEAVQLAQEWGFLVRDPKEKDDQQDIHFLKNPQKETSLWWYRGTIFHIIAAPALVAALLLENRSEDLIIAQLEARLTALRTLWEEELFWPDASSTASIMEACLHMFAELKIIDFDPGSASDAGGGRISLQRPESSSLLFFADLIRPERELYGLQLASALSLVESHGEFSRDEVIRTAVAAHRSAFLRGVAFTPTNLSKVFGARTVDALLRSGAFTPHENHLFGVAFTEIASVADFFEITTWREFVGERF